MADNEKGIFETVFGTSIETQIVDHFVLHPRFDFDSSELSALFATGSDVVMGLVLPPHIESLLHFGLIKCTTKGGDTPRYQFDKESQTGRLLNSLCFKLVNIDLSKLIRDELEGKEDDGKEN